MSYLLVLLFIAVALATPCENEWTDFTTKYSKKYGDDEFRHRYGVFCDNLAYINKFNTQGHSYTLAVNEFADLTTNEFQTQFLGLAELKEQTGVAHVSTEAAPASIDWRKKGAVTPIKNQGQCGSCWSFSATGSMEGQHYLVNGTLVGLSEQNLIDCSTAEGNMGCDGGLMDDAFKYVIKNRGIDTEASYPYTATGPNTCEYKAANIGATITAYTDIPSGNEDSLENAVGTVGPVSVAMDASHVSFQFYSSGIYWSHFCSSTKLDHGVLAVGYGTEASAVPEAGDWNEKDFWIVKNSWGTSWGADGYFKLARNDGNMCGVATAASYPTV